MSDLAVQRIDASPKGACVPGWQYAHHALQDFPISQWIRAAPCMTVVELVCAFVVRGVSEFVPCSQRCRCGSRAKIGPLEMSDPTESSRGHPINKGDPYTGLPSWR